jgi:hypothetical protein
MVLVANTFKNWLKSGTNIKLSSDAAVNRIIHEGITTFESLADFDKKSIERLPQICKENIPAIVADQANGVPAEEAVNGANISSISVRRLITASHAVTYYISINRALTTANMHYNNVLLTFKTEWEAYQELRDADEPKIPKINDRDAERKVIKWVPIFLDCMSRTFGAKGPLRYVLRENPDVPNDAADPLDPNAHYGTHGSLLDELINRLPHDGPIFRNDNKTVYMKIDEAARGTSVESTVKAFSRRNDGRGAFLALIANHAGDTKYRSIMKKRLNLLQNIKWNGRAYPLESHVSNHRQAVDDIRECAEHITVSVPDNSQRVEYLIDSISCFDNTLQAAIGLIRANTNNMRNDFEVAASALIEVDPYKRSQRMPGNPKEANVSGIDFNAGRGETGVDLRWHPKSEFMKLSQEQRNELSSWQKTDEGRKTITASRKAHLKKRNSPTTPSPNKPNMNGKTWKSKFKKALRTDKGLKTVMSLMAEEEKTNTAFVAALQSLPPVPAPAPVPAPQSSPPQTAPATASAATASTALAVRFPATQVKLQSILKNTK